MNKLGLKLWSVNVGNYLAPARELYMLGVYDYIELYVVPGSLSMLNHWTELNIPFIIHNAHFANGFNLAKREKRESNAEIYNETKKYADQLRAPYIIFHGGIDGDVEETAYQLRSFHEPRALIENKPFDALPNKMGGRFCRGATFEEINYLIDSVGCDFCLDIGHAICSANSQNKDRMKVLREFNSLHPKMYHLSDIEDLSSCFDAHPNLGTGKLDIGKLKREIINPKAFVSIETNKNYEDSLKDFESDVKYFRSL